MSNTGNTQQIIDYGAAANDGQGDPLRTAFIKTDENFDNIWAAGPVGSNITIVNNTIQNDSTNGNIILKPNGTGIVQSNASAYPNMSDVRNLGAPDLRWRTLYVGTGGVNSTGTISTANLSVDGDLTVGGDATIEGNLIVEGDTIQIGNITTDTLLIQLANAATTDAAANGAGVTVGANDDIATLLYDSANNSWTTNIGLEVGGPITGTTIAVSDATVYGNLNGVDADFTGNVIANAFIGDGSQLTDIDANNITGLANIAYTGSWDDLVDVPTLYANANAAAYGEAGWAGNIIPAANAYYSLGDSGNQWKSLWVSNTTIYINEVPVGVTSSNVLTVDSEPVLSNNSDTSITTTGNIAAGNLFAGGQLSATGNVTGSYLFGNISQATGGYGNANVVANLAALSSNPISTAGNVTAGYLFGNGSQLTGMYGNANVVANLAALSSNPVSTTGNITGNYILGNGSQLTGLPATYGNANVATFLANYGSNTISTLGNITAGNFIGNVSITGNITGTLANVELIAGAYTWTFNNAGNLVLPANTFAVNYANGTAVSLGGNYGNANVVANLAALSSNPVSTTGNITAGNLITTGTVSTSGGLSTTGALSAGAFLMTGVLTPAALTTNTNNWSIAGLSGCNFLRASATVNVSLTGIVAPSPAANQLICVVNLGPGNINILRNNPGSSPGNQFINNNDVLLNANEAIVMMYDAVSLGWRIFGIQN